MNTPTPTPMSRTSSAGRRVRGLWSFQGKYRVLHLTWIAFFLSFVVWFNFAPFANTIAAIINGVNYLDGSLYGIGRGAGNCPLELLLSFLKNPKFRVRPLIEVIESHIIPWHKKIDWGYFIPYMITGVLNQHPRAAMAHMESERKERITDFFNQVTNATDLV
jgi:hypothetical protein